jgi:hypothetical protein
MSSPHSKQPKKAKFVKHLPFEVASSLSDAKFIAEDIAEGYRYNYRGTATLAGNANVKVGEVIYLDNLDQNMSGYWTVLSVSHIFGSGNMAYQIQVELGADKVGDSDPSAGKNLGKRDFEAELANQSLNTKGAKLNNYSIGVNNGKTDLGVKPTKSFKNVPSPNARPAPTKYTPNIYKGEVPDFSQVRREVSWSAK